MGLDDFPEFKDVANFATLILRSNMHATACTRNTSPLAAKLRPQSASGEGESYHVADAVGRR